ncbi:class IV adenylate cyclase [Candidatus Wolfebacteria bacterium]|nr:class IV adenylate cyclase [Candidatus Wolfebacteria bacterium]
MTELEVKFPEIDVDAFREKLRLIGAQLASRERLMKRKLFDFPDRRLDAEHKWVRLRDEGDTITLAFKSWHGNTIDGTEEISFTVGGFEEGEQFLLALGLTEKSYRESKRESWECDGAQVEIDTWPWIPSFVEIEGPSEEKIKNAADVLGLTWDKRLFGAAFPVYAHYFDIEYRQFDNNPRTAFGEPVPQWMEEKRRR